MVLNFSSNFKHHSQRLQYKTYTTMCPHNIDSRPLHPQRFPQLSSLSSRDSTLSLLHSMIDKNKNRLEPSSIPQPQRSYPQNGRFVSRLEVEDSTRFEEEDSTQLEDRRSPPKSDQERGTQSVSPVAPPPKCRRSRLRYEVLSMVEYLTLGQLEDIWRKQDAYTDYVDMPQRTVELMPTIRSTQHTSLSQGVYQDPTSKVSGLSNTTKPSITK